MIYASDTMRSGLTTHLEEWILQPMIEELGVWLVLFWWNEEYT